jgi:hypothetical protein
VDRVGTGGGSLALAELIDKHGTALVADFLSEYGVRLVDVVFEWPAREVLALVEGLPDNKVFAAYLAGGAKWREFHGWGKDRHVAADRWDAAVSLAFSTAGSKKKPPTYPRPNVKKPASSGTPLFAMRPRAPKGD